MECGSGKATSSRFPSPTVSPMPSAFSSLGLSDQLYLLHEWQTWGQALPILSPLRKKEEEHLLWAAEQRTQCLLAAGAWVWSGWAGQEWRMLIGFVPPGTCTGGRPSKLEEEGEAPPGFQVLA